MVLRYRFDSYHPVKKKIILNIVKKEMIIVSYKNYINNVMVKIFKSNVPCYNKQVHLGETVLVVVRAVNPRVRFLKDERIKFKFVKGSIHKLLFNLLNKKRNPFFKKLKLRIEILNKCLIIGSIVPKNY